jgi:hypothetical protein
MRAHREHVLLLDSRPIRTTQGEALGSVKIKHCRKIDKADGKIARLKT